MFLRNPPNVPACIKNYAFAFSLVEIGFMFLLTFLAGRKKCVLLPVPSSAGSDASPSFLSRKKMNSVHFPSFISSDGGLYRLHVCRKGFSILCRSIITIEKIAMNYSENNNWPKIRLEKASYAASMRQKIQWSLLNNNNLKNLTKNGCICILCCLGNSNYRQIARCYQPE